VVDAVPADLDVVRYWDLAATEKTELNDPDWTVGIKLAAIGTVAIGCSMCCARGRIRVDVERLLLNTATQDGKRVQVGFGQDPGRPARARRCTWCAR